MVARRGLLLAVLLWGGGLPLAAQVSPRTAPPPPVAQALSWASKGLAGVPVPPASAFVNGDREIKAGTTVKGPVSIVGTLHVAGTIDGDAFTYAGDIVLAAGGHITGSAYALNGRVLPGDGMIDGEALSQGGWVGPALAVTPPETASHDLLLTLGWASVALLVGIGLLVFGGPTLSAVGDTVDHQFGRSFVVGIAATLGIVPVLALLVIGLALTVIGILLIPFAIVAYVLAVIGLVTLGFLAAVRVTGQSLPGSTRTRALGDRGATLRALVLGLIFFLSFWIIAALLTPLPTAMSVVRLVAFALTWAAATVGLGATIISRAGTRPLRQPFYEPVPTMSPPPEQAAAFVAPLPDWQTPTPVAGVVAARRSSSTRTES